MDAESQQNSDSIHLAHLRLAAGYRLSIHYVILNIYLTFVSLAATNSQLRVEDISRSYSLKVASYNIHCYLACNKTWLPYFSNKLLINENDCFRGKRKAMSCEFILHITFSLAVIVFVPSYGSSDSL